MSTIAATAVPPADPDLPRTRRKWLVIGIKLLVVALVVVFARHAFLQAWEKLKVHSLTIQPSWLVAAGVLYLLGLAPSGWFWRRLMVALGQKPGVVDAMTAYFIGHLGKYVPGKALVMVIRAGMIRGPLVDVKVAAACVAIETLTMMAVGAVIALIVLSSVVSGAYAWVVPVAALATGIGLLIFLPALRHALKIVERRKPLWLENLALRDLSWKVLVPGWLWITLGWALQGLSLWATLRALGATDLGPISDLPLCTAAASISVVAGFLSFFPAGLVAREAVMLLVLDAAGIDPSLALAVAVLQRLVSLVSELGISAILYLGLVLRKGRR